MYAVLSLLSAALYGAADFVGGFASRQTGATGVVVISQFAGLCFLIVAIPVLPEASPSGGDLLWGAAAGLSGGTGVALLYKALAIGTMGVVAPTTAVCAVAIPVLSGFLLGERPGAFATAGIVLAIVAIVLVSRQATPAGDSSSRTATGLAPGLMLALLSGVAIGLFFLSLARTSGNAGMWPLVTARATSVSLFGLMVAIGRHTLRMPRRVLWMTVGGGVVDMLANVLYLAATRYGPLTIVVTLSSLYPASTVLLARMVLGERLSRVQHVGIVCALVAVVLIVGGA